MEFCIIHDRDTGCVIKTVPATETDANAESNQATDRSQLQTQTSHRRLHRMWPTNANCALGEPCASDGMRASGSCSGSSPSAALRCGTLSDQIKDRCYAPLYSLPLLDQLPVCFWQVLGNFLLDSAKTSKSREAGMPSISSSASLAQVNLGALFGNASRLSGVAPTLTLPREDATGSVGITGRLR